MKKITLTLALLCVAAVLAACGDGNTVTDAPATDAPVTTEAPLTTEAPAVTDEPADTSDTAENTGFDLPMVPV